MMRTLIWLLRFLLFFLLLGFAIKNDHLTSVKFFFGAEWQFPLMFIILVSFAMGVTLGVTATFASLLSKQREIWLLKRQIRRLEQTHTEAITVSSPNHQASEAL